MTALLPMLMAYSLIGEQFHEIAGTLMFALFITHHVLNRGWYRALFRGRYTAKRIFQTGLNMALLVFMILQPVSGILMSKHLYTFINIPGAAASVREIHLLLAYWGLVLMCIHAGTHLTVPLGKLLRCKAKNRGILIGILGAVSLYGCYAFVKRQLADYMFMKTAFVFFDYSEPRAMFIIDYTAIMILFMCIGCLIMSGLMKADRIKKRRGDF